MTLKLDIQALRSNLNLPCEFELHIFPNTKISAARNHGEGQTAPGLPHPVESMYSTD